MKYFMVGIKGTGMSALANILVDLGNEVIGVDYNKKYFTEATFRDSIIVKRFEDIHLSGDYFYIIGNAFKLHDITDKIKELGYSWQTYPEFIESFFTMKKIGISGSHGKTTTTSFVSQLLEGKVNALVGDGSGFGNKNAKHLVFEACEYQNHFHSYSFEYLVILNIDYDHPDFFKSASEYTYAFMKAALNAKMVILNYDDVNCRKIIHKNKLTFGFNPNADIVLRLVDKKLHIYFFEEEFVVDFNYYGSFMAYNIAASFIVGYLINNDALFLLKKVKKLKLPARRLEEVTLRNGNVLVNDYAHHPNEVNAVIEILKNKYPKKILVVVFQGHTYSRTNTFYKDYVNVLKKADRVYIMPTFSSIRESDSDSYQLLSGNEGFMMYDRSVLEKVLEDAEIVVAFLGAGDIDSEFIFLNKKLNY